MAAGRALNQSIITALRLLYHKREGRWLKPLLILDRIDKGGAGMSWKKKGVLFLIIALIGAIAIILYFNHHISGDKLLNHIQMDNITQVSVKKTLEDSDSIEDLGHFYLCESEIQEFFEIFSSCQLKDIRQQSFPISTDVRYYVFLFNSEGNIEGTMKFYEDDVLIFDYIYGDRPAIHKRYSIMSSSFKNFFESIILLNTEGSTNAA